MLVLVRTLAGKTAEIEIEGSDTVDLLKCKVLDQWNILPAHQNLVYSGKPLQDTLTLNDYDIARGSTIYMVLRLPGGDSPSHSVTNVDDPLRPV